MILNVIGSIIAGVIIEILGIWTYIIYADILWIIFIIKVSPVMTIVMVILSGMAIALMTLKLTLKKKKKKTDLKNKFMILNVIGSIIASRIIEILGIWICIITVNVLWIMSIIGDSPVMTVISHLMLTLTTPLFLFEEPPKIKGELIVIIFKRIILEI